MLSRPRPYTELLPDVCTRLIGAAVLISSTGHRLLTRVGIVSTTNVSEEEAPPGIRRFIRYVAQPWGKYAPHYHISVTSDLGSVPGWSDRCVHTIVKPDDPDALVTMKFDFQRQLNPTRKFNAESIRPILKGAQDAALKYFEDLAEGNLFDVQLLRKTV